MSEVYEWARAVKAKVMECGNYFLVIGDIGSHVVFHMAEGTNRSVGVGIPASISLPPEIAAEQVLNKFKERNGR